MNAPQQGPQSVHEEAFNGASSADVTPTSPSGDGPRSNLPRASGRGSSSSPDSPARRYRRVIETTCQQHGMIGFTNLLVTKEDGVIVLNPHAANCCVLRLEEPAATELHEIIGEWLG